MSVTTFHQIGTGLTVFEHDEVVEAPVKWLDSPAAVLDFVTNHDPAEWIVVARGGTTTFLTPALSAGVRGVMTLQGSPESHLGILAREFGIPCVMSVAFTEGVRSERGEVIPADGAVVRLDARSSPQGTVEIEDGAPVADAGTPATSANPELDPETAAQMQALMSKFRAEVPNRDAGDRHMRRRMRTTPIDHTDASVRRDLDPQETDDFLSYCAWNLWDLIAARQTEGESGLIPRQEYETVSFVQQWATYAPYFRRIEEAIGADGIIELGGTARRELGSKINHIHIWANMCPLVGRGITTSLGLEPTGARPDDLQTIVRCFRQLQFGLWGEGPGFVSSRGYQPRLLQEHWLERFRDEEVRFTEPEQSEAFRKFNATTELCGFLFHYDCRAGLCDTGPYPLEDGGFVIVRDHFLHDPGYEWAGAVEGLPHAITQAMFFRPDGPQEIRINDIATTFATPANYLKHLSGTAVYARDRWDSPMSELRPLGDAEMAAITERCAGSMTELYGSIGSLSRDERIRNGVKVYCRDMMMPYARVAGLWDEFLADGFDEPAPLTEQAWPGLTGGGAQEVLGAVFLMGSGVVPDAGLPPLPAADPAWFERLHALALRGGAVGAPQGADELSAAGLITHTVAGWMLTEDGHAAHAELLGTSRDGLDVERLAALYDRFLAANSQLKTACTRAAGASAEQQALLLAEIAELVERVEPALRRTGELIPRFAGYEPRLRSALDQASGDWGYVTSTSVESVHTVWMEAHEDYLQTLGRSREAEGSY